MRLLFLSGINNKNTPRHSKSFKLSKCSTRNCLSINKGEHIGNTTLIFHNILKDFIFILENIYSERQCIDNHILYTSHKPLGCRFPLCAIMPVWRSANGSGNSLIQFQLPYIFISSMPVSCVGSLSDRGCVFQKSSHVQQCFLHSLGKVGSICLLTAVEGCDGNVDVLIHGIVAHSIAIWHHWTKAHHTVCLGANLDMETETTQHM